MTNLRERVERDLVTSIEKEWGLPVKLVSPDGVIIETSVHTGNALVGQVLYDTVRINPDTGEEMVVGNPVVVLRRSSLSRVPEPGEKWIVKIPTSPSESAALEDFIIDPSRPPEGGRSIGFIRLYLRRAVQSS